MGFNKPNLLALRQATMNTSTNGNFYTTNIAMSTFMGTDAENGMLWVIHSSGTNAVLQVIMDTGSASTVAMSLVADGAGTTAVGTNIMFNYRIPVMGDDAVNFKPSVAGTTNFFIAYLMV